MKNTFVISFTKNTTKNTANISKLYKHKTYGKKERKEEGIEV